MRRALLVVLFIGLSPSEALGAIAFDSTAHPGGAGVRCTISSSSHNGIVDCPDFATGGADRLIVVSVQADTALGQMQSSSNAVSWVSTPAGASAFTKLYEWPIGNYATQNQVWAAWASQTIAAGANGAIRFTTGGTAPFNIGALVRVHVLTGTADGSSSIASVRGSTSTSLPDGVNSIPRSTNITPQDAASWIFGLVHDLGGGAQSPTANIGAWDDTFQPNTFMAIGRVTSHGTSQIAVGATGSGAVTVAMAIEILPASTDSRSGTGSTLSGSASIGTAAGSKAASGGGAALSAAAAAGFAAGARATAGTGAALAGAASLSTAPGAKAASNSGTELMAVAGIGAAVGSKASAGTGAGVVGAAGLSSVPGTPARGGPADELGGSAWLSTADGHPETGVEEREGTGSPLVALAALSAAAGMRAVNGTGQVLGAESEALLRRVAELEALIEELGGQWKRW